MKRFTPLLLLSSVTTGVIADTAPIEPVLVPLSDAALGINVQMGKYEVTVAEFSRFVNATGYQVPKKCMLFSEKSWPSPDSPGNWDDPELIRDPYRPVVCIGVRGAMAYADWLAKRTGKAYRLPERNEWQLAASAGRDSRLAFGEDLGQRQICEYENVEDIATVAGLIRDHQERYDFSANCNDGAVYHTVVGMYRPNRFGLHDMVGNVKELLQTCHQRDESAPEGCVQYGVAGEAWHWQARGTDSPDWIAPDFHGGIEGFRLVLDSGQPGKVSEETRDFMAEVSRAQARARIDHQRLKSLPDSPRSVSATPQGAQVALNWQKVPGDNIRYSIQRSRLDLQGKTTREVEVVAKELTAPGYLVDSPEAGVDRYWIFAHSDIGESIASETLTVGEPPVFSPGQRIEAEYFRTQRHTWIQNDKHGQSVGFSGNPGHYPTGRIPFLPAWLTFDFNSPREGSAKLKIRFRSKVGAEFEIWQGHHLVARLSGGEPKRYVEHEAEVSLIAGDWPLEIRSASQDWLVFDWLEFSS